MKISARLSHRRDQLETILKTNENSHSITLEPKSQGSGSATNGGELLFLALATCFCNDIYREAKKSGMEIISVEVTVEGTFGGEGEPARDVVYGAKVAARAGHQEIEGLIRRTDLVAEIHNTLRASTPVLLRSVEAISL